MPLSQEQEKKAIAAISKKYRACPMCGSSKYSFGEIIQANNLAGNAIVMGSNGVPMLQVVCPDCFHVSLFAAVPLGLLS